MYYFCCSIYEAFKETSVSVGFLPFSFVICADSPKLTLKICVSFGFLWTKGYEVQTPALVHPNVWLHTGNKAE